MSTERGAGTPSFRETYGGNVDDRLKAAGLAAMALAAALSPVLLEWLVAATGTRTVAAVVAVASAVAALRARRPAQRLVQLAAVLLAMAAATTGDIAPMLLLPAIIYATLAFVFLASAREDASVVERVAKAIEPAAPDFIAPYCRRVSVLWGVVFFANAVALAAAALLGSQETWRAVAGFWVWACMAVIAAAEFLVRKTYFRNYWYLGPFERVWSRLFPSDATPMGRRSAEHIRLTRERMGLK